jgi:hypothetical protein
VDIERSEEKSSPLDTFVVVGLHSDEVDDTLELVVLADRDLNSGSRLLKLVSDLTDDSPGVSTLPAEQEMKISVSCKCSRKEEVSTRKGTDLSILLMKEIRGTLYRFICLSTVMVWD